MAKNENKELLLYKVSILDLSNLCAIYGLKVDIKLGTLLWDGN